MNRILLFFRRIHLLNRRFLKTPVFLALLLLLPLSALLLNLASKSEDIGIKVGYVLSPKSDEYTKTAALTAFANGSLVKCTEYSSYKELSLAVEDGKILAGFAFPESLQDSFRQFEKGKSVKNPIRVIVKKNTVVSRLITELVFGRLFSRISPVITKSYIEKKDSAAFKNEEDAKIFVSMYERNRPPASVFSIEYASSAGTSATSVTSNASKDLPLLATPVRGLSSIFLLLVGFAAAFYYLHDEKEGLFLWLSRRSRIFLPIFYIFIPVFDAALVMILSLYFSGTFVSLEKELPLLLAYATATAAFCSFCCLVLGDQALLAGLVPLVLLATFILCPVFISIKAPTFARAIFPPYIYLTRIYKAGGIYDLLFYTAIALAASLLASFLRNKFSSFSSGR